MPGHKLLRITRRARSAFTLVELMVVIVIIGILATIVVPNIFSRPEQARRAKAKAEVRILQSALAQFKIDTGQYPVTAQGLEALVNDPGVKGWNSGGYLQQRKVPLDPWGNPYVYVSPGVHGDYDLESYGRDGEDGGADSEADIESWNLAGD